MVSKLYSAKLLFWGKNTHTGTYKWSWQFDPAEIKGALKTEVAWQTSFKMRIFSANLIMSLGSSESSPKRQPTCYMTCRFCIHSSACVLTPAGLPL